MCPQKNPHNCHDDLATLLLPIQSVGIWDSPLWFCCSIQLLDDHHIEADLHYGVEHCQPKQQLVEGALVGAAIKEVRAGERVRQVRAQQAGLETLGRLIGHLHSILKDGDGEDGGWVAGQPQAEVSVHLHMPKMRCLDEGMLVKSRWAPHRSGH